MDERISQLEKLAQDKLPESLDFYENKYEENFNKFSTFMGNGVYQWSGLFASDIRELFLIGILKKEGIHPELELKNEDDEDEEYNPPYQPLNKRV